MSGTVASEEITYRTAESCQHRHSTAFRENGINPYIWCVVGGLLGGAAGLLFKSGDRIVMIENVGVGIFGAYIGGDFIASMLNGGVINDTDFSMRSLGLAIGGSVACLALLRLMRRTVGPMQAGKSKRRP